MEYQWIDPILLVELRGHVYATSKICAGPKAAAAASILACCPRSAWPKSPDANR